MATYNIGTKLAAIGSATSAPITRTYVAGIADLSAYGNTLSTSHVVQSGQRITKFVIGGQYSTVAVAGSCTLQPYLSATGVAISTKQTLANASPVSADLVIQYFEITVNIDLAAYVGQTIDLRGGYSSNFRWSRLSNAMTSGDAKYSLSDCPPTFGAGIATTTMPQMWMVIEDTSLPTITDVNGDETVYPGQASNSWANVNYTPTAASIGGKACTSVTSTAFEFPDRIDGGTYPGYGAQTLVGSDGAVSPTISISLIAKPTEQYVGLVSPLSSVGYIGSYIASSTGDQVALLLPSALGGGVIVNEIDPDGRLKTDHAGIQTFWHWNHTTGVTTRLNIDTTSIAGARSLTSRNAASRFLTFRNLTKRSLA